MKLFSKQKWEQKSLLLEKNAKNTFAQYFIIINHYPNERSFDCQLDFLQNQREKEHFPTEI